jgi:hypothetical protein
VGTSNFNVLYFLLDVGAPQAPRYGVANAIYNMDTHSAAAAGSGQGSAHQTAHSVANVLHTTGLGAEYSKEPHRLVPMGISMTRVHFNRVDLTPKE